jgi:hypothetical protein
MGKKKAKSASGPEGSTGGGPERGAKSNAIRAYLAEHKNAKPKEVVAALKAQGMEVSPNMVSILRAKAKVRKAKRNVAAASSAGSSGSIDKSRGLEAALTLYKAAKGQEVPGKQVSSAFLSLVEMLS